MVTNSWRTAVCCACVSVVQTVIGLIRRGRVSCGSADLASGDRIVIGGVSFPTTRHQQIFLQELLQRFDRNGKGVEGGGIIFQIGRGDGDMSFHSGTNPDGTATT